MSDSKENQTYELSTSNSPYNLSINDDDQEEEDEEEDEEDNEEEDEEDKDEEEEDDDEVDSIDILYKIGRKGMKQFINDYTSEDACTNNDKSECNSDSACTWINYDYTKSKKTIGTKCITTSSFKKLPQSSEDDCCSPIRTTSCSGMVHCIDKHSDKYLSGYDYPQFGGNNSEIDNIIRLESQLEDLDEELAYLTHKKMRLISNDKSYDSLGERVEGIKIKSELGPDRVLYDINCEDIDLENCGENDKLFKFCKKSDDSLHCERNNQKLLNLEFVETGNVDEFRGEERLTYEALHIVKYLVMNINLYNNCVYGSEINTLSRDYSNTELVSNIKEYINSFISLKSEKISTNINLVDYISSTIGNINEISQKVKGFIDENTQLDGSNRRVLKRGNLAHDVIIFLSGITIKLINDQLISRFIKHTVTNNYTNKCSLVKFKNGSKNTFDIVNNLENIVDFSDNERAFMKSIVTNTEATLDNSEFKNKALNKFLITKTRSEDANFSREIEKLLSKNKEDFINDTNLVGKLKESLSYVDIDGNILEDSQIYDKDINKYSQIIDLVDKLNFYMDYYPRIKEQLKNQPYLLVDSKLYFEDMIVLPYMNAAYLIMLYYPVIEHIVNDKYI